jgi:uncharacterized protein YbaA (DUF1428 family)
MYIDGFVVPVPTARRDDYQAHEIAFWPAFRKGGATSMVVGWADDVPHGKQTDFYRAVAATEDETVVFCWITWPDKATRDTAYKAMMEDGGQMDMSQMPFDAKRMIYGGFSPLVIDGDPI